MAELSRSAWDLSAMSEELLTSVKRFRLVDAEPG